MDEERTEEQQSILVSIKALLGPDSFYDVFDTDIIMHINSAISVLTQLGVGPSGGFMITGPNETWGDFIGSTNHLLNMVKTYIYMKVRIAFDPPTNPSVLTAFQESCKEYEWRINVAVDPSHV